MQLHLSLTFSFPERVSPGKLAELQRTSEQHPTLPLTLSLIWSSLKSHWSVASMLPLPGPCHESQEGGQGLKDAELEDSFLKPLQCVRSMLCMGGSSCARQAWTHALPRFYAEVSIQVSVPEAISCLEPSTGALGQPAWESLVQVPVWSAPGEP